ncbi:hypothetical protein Ancab_035576 [Ancistrocladus abbreviatus]
MKHKFFDDNFLHSQFVTDYSQGIFFLEDSNDGEDWDEEIMDHEMEELKYPLIHMSPGD